MKLVFDLHTHTISSGHAYSSLKENMDCAKEAGLLAYGHSEHAEKMPGSVDNIHFINFKVIPKEYKGMKILGGVEANIMDYNGTIDVQEVYLKKVDYVIASLHTPCIEPATMELNTSAICGAMENPYVKIIGHPDDSRYPLDLDIICKKANETGTLIEINNSSIHPLSTRVNGRENMAKLLMKCQEHGTKVIVNTDSHFCEQVGVFTEATALIEEVGFDKELIVNRSIEGLKYILEK